MKISQKKQEKISEQIVYILFLNYPKSLFVSKIAAEIARDEEFTKKILLQLYNKKIVTLIKKNPKGKDYLRRSRWKLNDEVYNIYHSKQYLK